MATPLLKAEDIARRVDLDPRLLEESCRETILPSLATFVHPWREVFSFLLDSLDIDDINSECVSEQQKRLYSLRKWKERLGTEATYAELINALLKNGSVDKAESLCLQISKEREMAAAQSVGESNITSDHPDVAKKQGTRSLSVPPAALNGDSCQVQQLSSDHSDDSDLEPKSDAMVEKLTYRCLDTEGMSENERSILRGRLTNDYRRINSKYSRLNRSIRKSLRDRQVTPQQLSEVLMELNAFSLRKHDKSKPLLAECLDEVENAKGIDNVFKILRPYGSFFDCYVIKHIVHSQLCTDDDRENLRQYLTKLSDYCKRSIYECPHFATPDQDPKFRKLVMKVDDDISKSFTIKAFDAFREKLATTLNIETHTLHLCSVEEGCLQITFQVPSFIIDELFPLSHEQKQALEELCIQKIDCDGIQFLAHGTFSRMHQTLLQSETLTNPSQATVPTASTGMPNSSRYCYIHSDGVIVDFHKSSFTFRSKKEIGKVQECKVLLELIPLEESSGLVYEKMVEPNLLAELTLQRPLHALLEIQDRAINKHLQVFLTQKYISDIYQKLLQYLRYLHSHRLTPKLEGRFGQLPWRQNSIRCAEVPSNFQIKEFVTFALDDPCSSFLTEVYKEDVAKLRESCLKKGGVVDELETYDFKMTSKTGKLDIRLKFSEGKPIIATVKKFEHKVAIFDILCLNRQYDMRVSLNTYESASPESTFAQKFVSTVSMPSPGIISFVPKAEDDEWTVAFIRHKKIETLFFSQLKYVVTISNVGQLPIPVEDMKHGTKMTISNTEYEQRSETELHNLCWEVSFGHQIGLTPEQSLVLFMGQDAIPPQVYSVVGDGQWSPEGVMKDFEKDGFMEMMEDINEIMDIPS